MADRIYLDYNATTPVRTEVVASMAPYWTENFGNPSSPHLFGQTVRRAVEESRETIAGVTGVSRLEEIFFTGSGTESCNLAVRGLALSRSYRGRHLVVSAVEHHAVIFCARSLEDAGFEVTVVPAAEDGIVAKDRLRQALKKDTILASIMVANNETGVVQDISTLVKTVKSFDENILFHTDASQAFGKVPVNVTEWGVDAASFSAQKIYGPKGVGVLYLKDGLSPVPMVYGGPQEKNIRAGTENVPGIVGAAEAFRLAEKERAVIVPRLKKLRDTLEERILENVDGARVNGDRERRICNTTNIWFPGMDAEMLLLKFDLAGLAVSAGAACTSGAIEPSHVILGMGLGEQRASSSIRFSLGRYTTEKEIDAAAEIVMKSVDSVRRKMNV